MLSGREVLDRAAYHLTKGLQKIFPRAPLLTEWPPLKRILVGGYWVVFRPLHEGLGIRAARLWRSHLSSAVFVGVTGSAGKSMTKELLAAILATAGECRKNPGNRNRVYQVARTILLTRPRHRFCVAEVATGAPGQIADSASILQPSIAVVTTIGDDHHAAFGSRDEIAREKAALVAALPDDGIAVLNADDPLVDAMAELTRGRVVRYGFGSSADFRASEVTGVWPERLSFTLTHDGRAWRVTTRLIGRHWVPSVLAALAGGGAAGIPVAAAVAAVATVEPMPGRLNAVEFPSGVTFLRDDCKAPLWSISLLCRLVGESRARRKIFILGTISDFRGDDSRGVTQAARRVREVADIALFVGSRASHSLKLKQGEDDTTLRAFSGIRELNEYLRAILQPSDLVVSKGSGKVDHLERLVIDQTTRVSCWRDNCGVELECTQCPMLFRRRETWGGDGYGTPFPMDAVGSEIGRRPFRKIIAGLGNPGPSFAQTPHNLGYETLDLLAGRFGVEWIEDGPLTWGAWQTDTGSVLLLKPGPAMNRSGPTLRNVARLTGLGAQDCLLLLDDQSLPLGSVRFRASGSDGGHLGVRSVLMAFQSARLPRLKLGIGVGHLGRKTLPLLAPWPDGIREDVARLRDEAVAAVLQWEGLQGGAE